MSPGRRGLDDLLADLAEAVDAAAELVGLGKERWDAERPLRLAGEAVVGRIGDIATKLPEELMAGTGDLPWAEIKGMRIVVDHADHGIDYERGGARCGATCQSFIGLSGAGPNESSAMSWVKCASRNAATSEVRTSAWGCRARPARRPK